MLAEICNEINNWFSPRDINGLETGRFIGEITIQDGVLTCDGETIYVQNLQHIRVIGSTQDGVYSAYDTLRDEVFYGAIWLMNVPVAVLELDERIEKWKTAADEAGASPYQSESFGGYSYTRKTSASGGAWTWRNEFKAELDQWRKIR